MKFEFPEWFGDWNKKNPTNIFGPAILVGAAGGALLVAVMLILWGEKIQTTSMQTGPRGTGMHVAEFNAVRTKPDPTIAAYGERGDQSLLEAMRAWTGIPDLLEDPDNYQSKVALRMIEMTQNINENWDSHVYAVADVGVTCYTCHRGEPVPSDIWFNITPVNNVGAGWNAVQNKATALSSYTSLPSTALEVYLTDPDSLVNVHDLESRVAGVPGLTEDVSTIQKTEMTYSLMNYFSNSLGVNCVFCHSSRAFYDPAEVTAQWGIAQLGRQMVIELNADYLIPIAEELPEERLGPIHGDAPKVGCRTCHKGYQRPMQGLNATADWPELMEVQDLNLQ